MSEDILDIANRIMEGAVDFHIHAYPDVTPRIQDMVGVMEDARRYGMKALVFKDHFMPTCDRCYFANKIVQDVKCIGSIALNCSVGGFNPFAVEAAAKLGAKVVWMPSVDSAWTIHQVYVEKKAKWLSPLVRFKDPKKGLTIFKEGLDGSEVRHEVGEILAIIKQYNLVLDILHISPKERRVLVDLAREYEVEKIVLTHPNCEIGYADIDEQRELVRKGVYMDYAFLPLLPFFDRQSPETVVKMIDKVGYENSLLCTDLGQPINPPPVEGYKLFLLNLLASGVSEKRLKVMACNNPADLLDL